MFCFGIGISCAAAPLGERLVECLTDPASDMLWCDGNPIPWKTSGRYVCHPLEQHQKYVERIR